MSNNYDMSEVCQKIVELIEAKETLDWIYTHYMNKAMIEHYNYYRFRPTPKFQIRKSFLRQLLVS